MAEIATKIDEAMKLDADALEAAKNCLADAMSWGCEPADALGSAIVEYLATRPVSDEVVEAAARAAFDAWWDDRGDGWVTSWLATKDQWIKEARAVLSALQTGAAT